MAESLELQESRPKRMKMESEAVVVGLLDLPNELLQNIFSNLSQFDVHRNVALVCKRFFEISRLPKLNENLKVNLVMDEDTGEIDTFFKIDKILKIFPACNLELNFMQELVTGYCYERIFPMRKLKRFAPSVKKLSMQFINASERDNFLYDMDMLSFKFENLESLVLDLRSADDEDYESPFRNHEYDDDAEWSGIQLAPSTIWKNISNLTYLRIKSNWEWRVPVRLFNTSQCHIFVKNVPYMMATDFDHGFGFYSYSFTQKSFLKDN